MDNKIKWKHSRVKCISEIYGIFTKWFIPLITLSTTKSLYNSKEILLKIFYATEFVPIIIMMKNHWISHIYTLLTHTQPCPTDHWNSYIIIFHIIS